MNGSTVEEIAEAKANSVLFFRRRRVLIVDGDLEREATMEIWRGKRRWTKIGKR